MTNNNTSLTCLNITKDYDLRIASSIMNVTTEETVKSVSMGIEASMILTIPWVGVTRLGQTLHQSQLECSLRA
jgi:hypothetical protein